MSDTEAPPVTEGPLPPIEPPEPRAYRECACGKSPVQLIIEVNQESKVGRATGDCCSTWSVEFLRGHATQQEEILDKAHAAWDSAPRAA